MQVSSAELLWFWAPLGHRESSWWQLHAEGCSQCHSKQTLGGPLWDNQAQCTEEDFHPSSSLLEAQVLCLSEGLQSSLPPLPPFEDPETKLILDHEVEFHNVNHPRTPNINPKADHKRHHSPNVILTSTACCSLFTALFSSWRLSVKPLGRLQSGWCSLWFFVMHVGHT